MVEVEGLGKRYGRRWVFRNLSFQLKQGDGLLVVGPNGSGKSTLLKTIAGLISPSLGKVRLPAGDIRHTLGFSALDLNLYPQLSVTEHIEFASNLRGCEPRSAELLDFVELSDAADKLASNLSTGMKSRLKLALAIQSNPIVLLLDEPGAGLDEQGKSVVLRICEQQRDRGVLIVATNDPAERELGNLILNFAETEQAELRGRMS